MVWKIEFLDSAARSLASLDKTDQARILRFLRERVARHPDPRWIGKPMRGNHSGRWRYRVGDYRLICNIEDSRLLVLVVKIGHRREVYR